MNLLAATILHGDYKCNINELAMGKHGSMFMVRTGTTHVFFFTDQFRDYITKFSFIIKN